MYINPFWCGVIATILVELGAIITYAIYLDREKKKQNVENIRNKISY